MREQVSKQDWNTKVGPILASSVPSIVKAKKLAELFDLFFPGDNAALNFLVQSIKEISQKNDYASTDRLTESGWSQTDLELTFDSIEKYFFDLCRQLRDFDSHQVECIVAGLLRGLPLKKRSLILYLFLLGPYNTGLVGVKGRDLIYVQDKTYQYWHWIMIKSLVSCEELEDKN